MSRSLARVRACALLVLILPLVYLSSGCSFLPTAARRAGTAAADGALTVTEATLKKKFAEEWRPAIIAEAKGLTSELAAAFSKMLSDQGAAYKAELEAKAADGRATTTERIILWLWGLVGTAGAGKGVKSILNWRRIAASLVHGVEAHTSGLPATLLGALEGKLKDGVDVGDVASEIGDALKGTIKDAATKAGVEPALYGVVHALTTPKT